MDIKASQELALPATPEAGTMYFIDNLDGTATQHVTSESGVPRRVLGGLLVPTALTRSGNLTTRLTKSGALLGQTITNTSGAPITLTSITVERVTLSGGTATLTIRQGNGGNILATAPATAQDGGLTGALNYTLAPGASVMGILQATGGTLTAQLSSGHTWQGLSLGSTLITGFSGGTGGAIAEDNGAPAAQLAFQFGADGVPARRLNLGAGIVSQVQGDDLDLDVIVEAAGGLRVVRDRQGAHRVQPALWADTIIPSGITGLYAETDSGYTEIRPPAGTYLRGVSGVPVGSIPELWDITTQQLVATGAPSTGSAALFDEAVLSAPVAYLIGIRNTVNVPSGPAGASWAGLSGGANTVRYTRTVDGGYPTQVDLSRSMAFGIITGVPQVPAAHVEGLGDLLGGLRVQNADLGVNAQVTTLRFSAGSLEITGKTALYTPPVGTDGGGGSGGPISLRFVTGAVQASVTPPFSPNGDNRTGYATTYRVRFEATQAVSFNVLRSLIAATGPYDVRVYAAVDATTSPGALLASCPDNPGVTYDAFMAGAISEAVLDASISLTTGQAVVIEYTAATTSPGTLVRLGTSPGATGPTTYAGGLRYTASTVDNGYAPYIVFQARQDTPKGTVNALDPGDFPVVISAAALTGPGVALLDDGSAAPRLIRRRADGSVWYGAAFTSAP